jgi:hypothetical protein
MKNDLLFHHVPSVLEIKQPQIATVDKQVRKDSFSQIFKTPNDCFPQYSKHPGSFDHDTSYHFINYECKWGAKHFLLGKSFLPSKKQKAFVG